jgi:uncharacterized protein (DUF2235 family)
MCTGAFGSGLDDNLSEVYNFIANNYERGDEIFLFGFSRGAYTARAIGGLICDAGLLRPLYMDAYAGMFTFYKARNNSGNGKADWEIWLQKASKQKMTIEVPKIKAIGVWDTVGALGLPETFWSSYPGTFHNTKLSSSMSRDPKMYTFQY